MIEPKEGAPSELPSPMGQAAAERHLIAGLGPHGERPTSPERLVLSEADATVVRQRNLQIAIVLHTTESDWARQQIAGITAVLASYGATVNEVVDCGFCLDRQIAALERLAPKRLDALISIPLGNTAALAHAYRAVAAEGTRSVLLDNVPVGLMPETDYVSVVSADNFGLGEIAAALLSPHVPLHGKIGLVAYRLGFFATTQREISFRRWIERERPDVLIRNVKFEHIEHVESLVAGFLDLNSDTAGLFAVWDGPAIRTMRAVASRGRSIPITTVDLGREVALAMAEDRGIKGVGAQRPYDQGRLCARVNLLALAGHKVPSWVALPGLPVTAANLSTAFKEVWHEPVLPDPSVQSR